MKARDSHPQHFAVNLVNFSLAAATSIMQRATLLVLNDCEGSCVSATVERSIPLNYRNVTDRWGFRPLTLNAKDAATRYAGRMARSADKTVVQLTGYDWAPEGTNMASRSCGACCSTLGSNDHGHKTLCYYCERQWLRQRPRLTPTPCAQVCLSLFPGCVCAEAGAHDRVPVGRWQDQPDDILQDPQHRCDFTSQKEVGESFDILLL